MRILSEQNADREARRRRRAAEERVQAQRVLEKAVLREGSDDGDGDSDKNPIMSPKTKAKAQLQNVADGLKTIPMLICSFTMASTLTAWTYGSANADQYVARIRIKICSTTGAKMCLVPVLQEKSSLVRRSVLGFWGIRYPKNFKADASRAQRRSAKSKE